MIYPSLLIKPSAYKANKLYAIVPDDGDGDMEQTSYAGNGTRTKSNGLIETVASDVPRIDYLYGPGLLMERTATNQATYSEDLTNAAWTKNNLTTSGDNTVAPDGLKTADKLEDTSESTTGALIRSITVSDATAVHSISFFVKFGNRDEHHVQILSSGTSGYVASFDVVSDGSVDLVSDPNSIIYSSSSDGDSYGSDRYPDGWFRFWFIIDMDNSDTALQLTFLPGSADLSDADQMGFCWFWGYQLEEGKSPTSYIPTVASTVQRLFDRFFEDDAFNKGLFSRTNCSFFFDFYLPNRPTNYNAGVSSTMMSFGSPGANSIGIHQDGDFDSGWVAEVVNSDATSGQYELERGRNKVLFNVFGSSTEVWVNGSKVLIEAKDLFINSPSWELDGGFADSYVIKEVAAFNRVLNDTQSKAMTQ